MAGLQIISGVDKVRDIMTGWVVTIGPADSLLKAKDLMVRNRVSQLVVVDERNRPLGLISKRDIARFLLEDPTTRGLERIQVFEASSKSIPSLAPDLPVFNAARLFDTENLAYAVVAADQPLSGIMTETDLCHHFSQKWPGKFKVLDFMSRDFIFAKSSYPLVHVAHVIVFRQPSIPVIDEELVGILTLSDLLSIKEKGYSGRRDRLAFTSGAEKDTALIRAKDVMTPNPVTTTEDADLAHAAQVIVGKGVGSLPVVGRDGKVVGLLHKHGIVTALGRIGRSIDLET